jgi:cytochrome c biogenesis protein CcmG/thiol:disulfide interchange protein DsbE
VVTWGMPRTSWVAAALIVLAAGCVSSQPDDTIGRFTPLVVGDSAPAYVAATLAGDTVRLGGAGPVTLLNLWATWCTSCREEFADLEELRRIYSPRGFRVVAVSVDQGSIALVRRFVDAQRVQFVVAHDQDARIQRSYGVLGLPSTYLIDRDGRIAWTLTGGIHIDTATVRREIEKVLPP